MDDQSQIIGINGRDPAALAAGPGFIDEYRETFSFLMRSVNGCKGAAEIYQG